MVYFFLCTKCCHIACENGLDILVGVGLDCARVFGVVRGVPIVDAMGTVEVL